MLIIVLFHLFLSNEDCRELYLNTVLEGRNYRNCFIVTKVNIGRSHKEIIVINHNLFSYLKSVNRKYSDTTYYKEELKRKLVKHEPILLGKNSLKEMHGSYVKQDSSVIEIAAKGKDYFMRHFFDISSQNTYARLKHDVSDAKLSQIIKTLFEWNYFVGIIEGNLTILSMKLCENR